MATGTVKSENKPPLAAGDAQGDRQSEQIIQSQLDKTSRFVKLVDIGGHMMAWAAGLLAALLLLALVDHWIVGLSFWARLLALIAIIGASLLFVAQRLLPPLFRHVNPIYAAHLIEQSEPSLKNSLISFLFLRSDRRGTRGVVYRAMQERAAADIAGVQVDSAVDRSKMIHIGYILVGILTVGGLYTILSPKDPFQTIARVAAPWKNIPRPSRVQITEVRPGDSQVYQGRSVEISAAVRSRTGSSDVPVWLVYGSPDGRIVDRRIRMLPPEGQVRHQGNLPDDGVGVQQDLVYRIEAGDAVTETYQIKLLPAPSIVVQQIEYNFPAYTGRRPTVVSRRGDIDGPEGSRVRITARANQPIKSAYLEFDPEVQPSQQGASMPPADRSSGQTIPMSVQGHDAEVRFTLYLQDDRRSPWHTGYQLRFTTIDGQTNLEPVLYGIDVTPDLPPVVEILDPTAYEIEVPEDGRRSIEVRAVDPDYALSSVVLRATSQGRDLLAEPLLTEPQSGQVTTRYDFLPRKLGLAEGDVVRYWAVAADNRMSARREQPEPNTSRTTDYTIRIVAPRRSNQSNQANDQGSDKTRPNQGPKTDDPQGDANDSSQNQQASGNDSPQEQDRGNDRDQNQEANESPEQPSSDQERSDQGSGSRGQGPDDPPDESSSQDGQSAGEDSQASGTKDGRGGTDGQNASGSESKGSQKDSDVQGAGSPSKTGAGDREGTENENTEPVPSDGERDGDAFERILKRMREQRADDSSRPEDKSDQNPTAGSTDAEGEPGEETPGKSTAESDDAEGPPRRDAASTPDSGTQTSGQEPDQPGQHDREPAGSASGDVASQQAQPPSPTSDQDGSGSDQQQGAQDGTADQQQGAQDGTADQQQGAQDGAADQQQGAQDGTAQESTDDVSPDGNDTPDNDSGSRTEPSDGTGGNEPGTQDRPPPGPPDRENSGSGADDADSSQADDEPGAPSGSQEADGGQPDSRRPGAESGPESQADDASPSEQSPPGTADQRRGQNGRSGKSGDGAKGDGREDPGQTTSPPSPADPGQPADGQSGTAEVPAGGQPGSATSSATDNDSGEPGGDDPNVEYARKATDLALEYLKDQQTRPDQELLDRLGWTQDDIRRFVERWERMKREAARNDDQGSQARRQLGDALRSLGLSPGPDRLRRGDGAKDQLRGVRQSGRRSRPPAEYRDHYDAYLRSTAREGAGQAKD